MRRFKERPEEEEEEERVVESGKEVVTVLPKAYVVCECVCVVKMVGL